MTETDKSQEAKNTVVDATEVIKDYKGIVSRQETLYSLVDTLNAHPELDDYEPTHYKASDASYHLQKALDAFSLKHAGKTGMKSCPDYYKIPAEITPSKLFDHIRNDSYMIRSTSRYHLAEMYNIVLHYAVRLIHVINNSDLPADVRVSAVRVLSDACDIFIEDSNLDEYTQAYKDTMPTTVVNVGYDQEAASRAITRMHHFATFNPQYVDAILDNAHAHNNTAIPDDHTNGITPMESSDVARAMDHAKSNALRSIESAMYCIERASNTLDQMLSDGKLADAMSENIKEARKKARAKSDAARDAYVADVQTGDADTDSSTEEPSETTQFEELQKEAEDAWIAIGQEMVKRDNAVAISNKSIAAFDSVQSEAVESVKQASANVEFAIPLIENSGMSDAKHIADDIRNQMLTMIAKTQWFRSRLDELTTEIESRE